MQDSSSVHRYRVLSIKARFWGGKISKLHNTNHTCNKPLISTDSHSMAAYIFLRWVLVPICSSQICHFREIMQLPTLKNSCFDPVLTVLSVAVRTRLHSLTSRKNSWSPYLDCTALTAQHKICVKTADCENTNKNLNFLMLGAA